MVRQTFSQQRLPACTLSVFCSCDRDGIKSSTKKIEALCLFRHPMHLICNVHCKWVAMHWSRWRRSSTLGCYLRVTGGGGRRLIHGMLKLMQFCVSFFRSVVTKRELSNSPKLWVVKAAFVLILTCGHESWVMTEKFYLKCKRRRWNFCEE